MTIQHRRLGESGFLLPVVGLGCNNFGRPKTATATADGTRAVVDAAIECGAGFFDGADIYGSPLGQSEVLLGAALRGRRDDVILATKFGHARSTMPGSETWGPKGGRGYIHRALEASLRRLETDYVDLYQMHSPDPGVPIAETLGALSELIDDGKVRFIGHTNFTADQLAEADDVSRATGLPRFASSQNEYSLIARGPASGVLAEAERRGLGFLPYYPLANGLLTGKYAEHSAPDGSRLAQIKPELLETVDWAQLRAYQQICDDAGLTMLQATFGWLLSRPALSSVIAGATTGEQVRANVQAAQTTLPGDVRSAIDDVFGGSPAAAD